MQSQRSAPAVAARAVLILTCLLAGVVSVAWGDSDPGRAAEISPVSREVDDATIERLRALHFSQQHEVRMVLLPTSVTDKKGRNIRDLSKEDFRLFDDQQPQDIRYFASEAREPISVAFVLDVSGSMRQMDKMIHAKEAIRFFVDQLRPDDRFALICFADDQVAWITEFTSDRWNFLRRLGVQEGYGQTALNDAIAAAPGLVDSGITGRKAIVLITDGNDNASRLNTFKAVQLARRVNVPIYTIGFASLADGVLPKGQTENSLVVLKRFATETGGHLFVVRDPDDLKEAVLRIQSEMRFQYVIGYHPTRTLWDGTFRKIKLETDRSRLTVRTRSGYYANP
jgi:Ca-activated chloride channel family protein